MDPENPFTLGLYGVVLYEAGKCQEALYYIEKGLSIDPDHPFCAGQLFKPCTCLGDYDRVFEYWKVLNLSRWEEYEVTEFFEKVFHEGGWIAFNEEAIKFNEEVWAKDIHLIPWSQAYNYINVGKYDKAVDYWEIFHENNNRDPNVPYISCKSQYDKLKGNQRYLELLIKMNLPID